MSTYRTPGVYIEEIPVFPPSVAPVETAIPGFIGYTDFAFKNGRDITNIPTPIKDLLEFRELFGGPPPNEVTVTLNGQNEIVQIEQDQGYLLYQSLQLFYANGGGLCYIVSVGGYAQNTAVQYQHFINGLTALEAIDEVTLLVAPDATLLDPTTNELYNLQQQMLLQCSRLQDRFTVMDLKAIDPTITAVQDFAATVDEFRLNIGIDNLKYGAVYAPYIISSLPIDIPFRSINLQDLGGGPIQWGTLTALDPVIDSIREDLERAVAAGDEINDGYENAPFGRPPATPAVAATFFPATVELESLDEYLQLLRSNALSNDLYFPIVATPSFLTAINAYVPATGSFSGDLLPSVRPVYDFITHLLIELSRLLSQINDTATFTLNADIRQSIQNNIVNSFTTLINLHQGSIGANAADTYFDNTITNGALAFLDALNVVYPNNTVQPINIADFTTIDGVTPATVTAPATHPTDPLLNPIAQANQAFDAALTAATDIIRVFENAIVSAQNYEDVAEDSFIQAFSFYKNLKTELQDEFNTLPPSGAVVGVYARIDETRGVFKAPANATVNAVSTPTVLISRDVQNGLNVEPIAGKSINAIRVFAGKGVLVWGARTLAGNDNEWRYVPVRRFFIFAEESIKKATEQFVFEPNDANTWVKVRALIENFLRIQWQLGALAGARDDDAFFVRVGLGETMTQQDILEGRMIVEIGMAVVRPAEFIILRFSHKMQEA